MIRKHLNIFIFFWLLTWTMFRNLAMLKDFFNLKINKFGDFPQKKHWIWPKNIQIMRSLNYKKKNFFFQQKWRDIMFHQIVGHWNVINYWILALQWWWTSLNQEAPKFWPIFCIFPSLVIFIKKFSISNKFFIENLTFPKIILIGTKSERVLR